MTNPNFVEIMSSIKGERLQKHKISYNSPVFCGHMTPKIFAMTKNIFNNFMLLLATCTPSEQAKITKRRFMTGWFPENLCF